jgi:hypothetical protein
MKIHESYSKKDLVKVINKYNIPNIDLKLTRYEIVKLLCDTETWNEYNLDFLEHENKNKALSIKEKNEIILKAQQLIALHKNGFILNKSIYTTDEEVVDEAKFISKYGDISSVRRSIRFVNEHYNEKIKPKLSNDIYEHLKHKEKIKKNSIQTISFKKGTFKVSFD